jgi:hypothetical protein
MILRVKSGMSVSRYVMTCTLNRGRLLHKK